MVTRRQSLWSFIAGPLLLFASACGEAALSEPGTLETQLSKLAKDNKAPAPPHDLRVTATTSSSASLAWRASVDNVGVASYSVHNNFGGALSISATQTNAIWTGLEGGTTYSFWVYALDAAGNRSASSNLVSVKLPLPDAPADPNDVTPPTIPTNVTPELYGDGSREIQVMWSKSTDDVTPQSNIRYQVFVNGVLENSTVGVSLVNVYGVAGDNTISVIAIDANGNKSAAGIGSINIPF